MTVRRIYGWTEAYEVTGAGYAPEGEFLARARPRGPVLQFLEAGVLASDAHSGWAMIGEG